LPANSANARESARMTRCSRASTGGPPARRSLASLIRGYSRHSREKNARTPRQHLTTFAQVRGKSQPEFFFPRE
jgi:hypothetical protein